MTIEMLKESNAIIFECIAGSKLYGLDTHNSDTDIRGVYILPKSKYYSLDYIDQVSNATNDIVYYELNKFVSLCLKNNPNFIELLYVPKEFVLYEHPIFKELKSLSLISKLCANTYVNYAYAQIKKAKGLHKKFMNPMSASKKEVLDFCYTITNDKPALISDFLKSKNWQQNNIGLTGIPHFKNMFLMYYSSELTYKGIVKKELANEVCLSSIPKGEISCGVLYFNKEAYSHYCKEYKSYWDWVKLRNESRYLSNVSNENNYDAKNMMHTFRLLQMAKEIALFGKLEVKRSNREELLGIKKGEYTYEFLLAKTEVLKAEIIKLFEESKLQETPNKLLVENKLIKIRDDFYKNC